MTKRFLSLFVALVLVIGLVPGTVLATETEAAEVATYEELVAALEAGGEIVLSDDITVDTRITVKDGTIIDLNENTLYINVEDSYYNNATITNGSIVLGKDDVHVCDGYFMVNEGKTLSIEEVEMTSAEGGIKGYAVFHLKTGASLEVVGSSLNIVDNEYSAGYIVYAGESTATASICNSTVVGTNTNGIVHATTTIEGSTFTVKAVEHGINRSQVTIDNSTVTISGGTGRGITAQHGDLTIVGESQVTITEMGEATIELRNDKNLTIDETSTVSLDKAVNNTGNGTITGEVVVPMTAADLAEAVAAGGEIVLENDIVLKEKLVVPADVTVTLDLNGKTVSMEDASGATAALLENKGNLTIKDSATDGKLTFHSTTPDPSNGYASNTISNRGTLTIESGIIVNTTMGSAAYALDNYAGSTATIKGGELTAEKTCVRIFNWTDGEANKATLNIEGGTILSKDGYAINFNMGNTPYAALNVSGGTIITNDTDYNLAAYIISKGDAKNVTINVTGGTFDGYFALNGVTATTMAEGNVSISGGTFEDAFCYDTAAYKFVTGGSFAGEEVKEYVVDGATVTINGKEWPAVVAKIGDVEYTSLADAFAEAKEGDTITVLDDVTLTETINVPAGVTVTLDLNGKTITGTDPNTDNKSAKDNFALFTNKGVLTVTDSGKTGTITLTATNNRAWNSASSVISNEAGTLTIEGGKLEHLGGTNMAYVIDNNSTGGETKVTVNGGTLISTYRAIRAFQNNTTQQNIVNITGGELQARACVWMQQPGKAATLGTLNITGGTFNSYSNAVVVDLCGAAMTDVNISNGAFSNENENANLLLVWPLSNMSAVTEDCYAKFTITGGTFDCAKEGNLIGALDGADANTTFTISGGTYSEQIAAEYLVADYGCFANEDGTYSVKSAVVAKIGDETFTDFAKALAAAKAMTGDVTVEIYDKVTLNSALSGSFDSIKFVGKEADAEIYLDVQGYITATGKKVAFEDLILSKSVGGFIYNAGFMNVAFGVYDVVEVTYTGCTFANGSYASSGKVTYTDCVFKRSHDKYGLWAYGNVDVTVDDCTFADYRGIKMYAEDAAKNTRLTVTNTDFSEVNNKPAIVLTYGQSVTLKGNTYSDTGVFELDLDGAPNGTPVTSDVPPTCVNDNGACGVLVDGKIYTTVAQAVEVAKTGSTITLLHDSKETVELAAGIKLDKNGYAAEGVTEHKHVYKEVVTEPTCTEMGYTTYTCECGDEYEGDYEKALGHNHVNGVCSRCGHKNGWVKVSGKWSYYQNDKKVTSKWVKDGAEWCYIGSDGFMVTNGWAKDSIGKCYMDENGYMTKDEWVKVDGKWYYLDAEGYMVTSKWVKDGDAWSYVGVDGYMLTDKWVMDGDEWCYVDAYGRMVTNDWAKDGSKWCYMDANGYMTKDAWVKVDGKWYYLDANGYKVANKWVKDGDAWSYVGVDGYALTNKWVMDGDKWCYVDADGHQVFNKWVKDGSNWCYIGADGYMVTNAWAKDGSKWCYVDANGHQVFNKWVLDGDKWCYIGADGYMVTNGWAKDGDKWCYMDANGYQVFKRWVKVGSDWYHMGSNGYMTTDKWVKDNTTKWCYVGSDGRMVTDQWVPDGSSWAYVDEEGHALTGTHVIDGKTYTFNSNGTLIGKR